MDSTRRPFPESDVYKCGVIETFVRNRKYFPGVGNVGVTSVRFPSIVHSAYRILISTVRTYK